VSKSDKFPEFWFDSKKSVYWLKLDSGQYIALSSREVISHLRFREISGLDKESSYGLKQWDRELVLCRENRSVDYAGPLAGHPIGLFVTQSGQRILVTSAPNTITPARGECPRWEQFLSELLPGEQSTRFLLWLKMRLESLRARDWRPGQLIVLAGPSGCGKSFLQCLLTEVFGGRMARPYSYMIKETAFNSHIAGAEHLVIADEQSSLDIRKRIAFGEAIKDLLVNADIQIHAKGRDISVTVPTFRAFDLSVNDEPERLAILPPLDSSLTDKITLFRCHPAKVGADRAATWKAFTKEIPALLWTLDKLKVPRDMRSDRYGVQEYHDPDLLETVSEISPEARLCTLIDEVVFKGDKIAPDGVWEGPSIELERVLRGSSFAFAVDKVLSFGSACGTYLARLQSKQPGRFHKYVNKGKTHWTIRKGEK